MYSEAAAKASQAISGLADKTNHQALAEALTVLHGEGKGLIRANGLDTPEWDAAIARWVGRINAVLTEHQCTAQEMHHVDVQHADLIRTFEQFKGKSRAVAVRTQRVADISTDHANIARDLALVARKSGV